MADAGRLGDAAESPKDHHKCGQCDHHARGPAIVGSPNVRINSRKALRVGDKGNHDDKPCCGPKRWSAVEGAPGVFINGQPAHRRGDKTSHCGGDGKLVEGSDNVHIGNYRKGQGDVLAHEGGFKLEDIDGNVLTDQLYVIRLKDGREIYGRTDEQGHTVLVSTKDSEELEVEILNEDPCVG